MGGVTRRLRAIPIPEQDSGATLPPLIARSRAFRVVNAPSVQAN